MTESPLSEALALALRLTAEERLQLIEQVACSIEPEIPSPPEDGYWGKALNRLLDRLDMEDWQALDIADPVEWVKHQRGEEQERRLGDWGRGDGRHY